MDIKLSVVIPLFNKEKSISRAIDSVFKQTFKNFELIIVNDGSTDNSLYFVEKIKDERIKIINKKNGGVSSARNVGIENAHTEWICFLDADDYWTPNHLEVINDLRCKYPYAQLYSTVTQENSEKGLRYIQNSLPDNFEGYVNNYFFLAIKGTLFTSSSVCVKKASFEAVGLFDTSLKHGEDLDMWFRLMKQYTAVIKKIGTSVYDLFGENRAMLLKCEFEKHLVSKIDKYRTPEVAHLNSFIDYYILRNSIPYYFSKDRDKTLESIKNAIDNNSTSSSWKYIYYDNYYCLTLSLYRIYKLLRHVKF